MQARVINHSTRQLTHSGGNPSLWQRLPKRPSKTLNSRTRRLSALRRRPQLLLPEAQPIAKQPSDLRMTTRNLFSKSGRPTKRTGRLSAGRLSRKPCDTSVTKKGISTSVGIRSPRPTAQGTQPTKRQATRAENRTSRISISANSTSSHGLPETGFPPSRSQGWNGGQGTQKAISTTERLRRGDGRTRKSPSTTTKKDSMSVASIPCSSPAATSATSAGRWTRTLRALGMSRYWDGHRRQLRLIATLAPIAAQITQLIRRLPHKVGGTQCVT